MIYVLYSLSETELKENSNPKDQIVAFKFVQVRNIKTAFHWEKVEKVRDIYAVPQLSSVRVHYELKSSVIR